MTDLTQPERAMERELYLRKNEDYFREQEKLESEREQRVFAQSFQRWLEARRRRRAREQE